MTGRDPVQPTALGTYEDVGVGLLLFGVVLGAFVGPTTILTWIESTAGVRSLPSIFWPMLGATALATGMILVGVLLLRIDQRDRQRRLQEFDSPPW